jgi:UrcA family protein
MHLARSLEPGTKRTAFMVAAGITAVVTALLLSATPARAADDEDQSRITVRFADLDLNTRQGTHQVYMRLRGAATTACGDSTAFVDLNEMRDIERCEQQAIETAVAQINRPMLTALYDKHFPHQPLPQVSAASLTSQSATTTAAR